MVLELDFRGVKTQKDVEAVFNKTERQLEKDIRDLGKLRELFHEDEIKPKEIRK